jgi:hypothetical protein
LFEEDTFFQIPGTPYSAQLPTRLRDGDSASFLMPVKADSLKAGWIDMMKEHLGKHPQFTAYFMKAQVITSLRQTYRVRIDSSIRKLLAKELGGKT